MVELPLTAEPPPLYQDEFGYLRVRNSRVFLDRVIYAHRQGMSPSEIVYNYGTLDLADVYAVIAYYLRHQDAVDAYLIQREAIADEAERYWTSRYDHEALRKRMEACRATLQGM